MKKIVVFCGSSLGFNPIYKEAAIELGNYFAKNKIGLVYGGGKIGMMGILADTILDHNGEVIGVIPKLLEKKEVVHAGVEEMIVCKKMSERKVIMSKLIDNYEKMYNKEMVSVIHTAFEDVPRVVAMVWVNSKNSIT